MGAQRGAGSAKPSVRGEWSYKRARVHAFCAMSTTSSQMSDRYRPRASMTAPGSLERAELADQRGSMNDLRIALGIAAQHGDLTGIDRNGFGRRPAVEVPCDHSADVCASRQASGLGRCCWGCGHR